MFCSFYIPRCKQSIRAQLGTAPCYGVTTSTIHCPIFTEHVIEVLSETDLKWRESFLHHSDATVLDLCKCDLAVLVSVQLTHKASHLLIGRFTAANQIQLHHLFHLILFQLPRLIAV